MTKQEKLEALRADTSVHYNCCQSVLIPFCRECGISEETAYRLGSQFGGGMKMGSVCGAVTGALMVLGMTGPSNSRTPSGRRTGRWTAPSCWRWAGRRACSARSTATK